MLDQLNSQQRIQLLGSEYDNIPFVDLGTPEFTNSTYSDFNFMFKYLIIIVGGKSVCLHGMDSWALNLLVIS